MRATRWRTSGANSCCASCLLSPPLVFWRLSPLSLPLLRLLPATPTRSLVLVIVLTTVCVECLGNYTEEEMNEALAFLIIILCCFFLVCTCQLYQRARWELTGNKGRRPMPMAPYGRDIRIV